MRWKKLRKTIIEHPYLISDDFHMSMRQAARIQEEEGYPSFEEMVVCARKRSPFTDSDWQDVYSVIEKYWKQISPKPRQFHIPIKRLTVRWVLAALCILLIMGYFTLVPSGKALASSIAKIIVEIFDDGLRFNPTNTPEPALENNNFEESITEYSDYDSVQAHINRPVVRFVGDNFKLNTIKIYEGGLAGSLLDASYYTQDGLHITLQQEWNIGGSPWFELETEHIWEETLWDDETRLYCYIDTKDNNKFIATAVWEDSIITIYAEQGVSHKEIVDSLYVYK